MHRHFSAPIKYCFWRILLIAFGATFFGNNSSGNIREGGRGRRLQTECIWGDSKTENAARAIHIIRIMWCKLNTIVITFKIIILLWFQIEHLKACSEVASSRISNWQAFCLQEKGTHRFWSSMNLCNNTAEKEDGKPCVSNVTIITFEKLSRQTWPSFKDFFVKKGTL